MARPGCDRRAELQSGPGITRKTAKRGLRCDRHFHHTVTMVRKEFIGVGYFVELEAMRKQGCEVKPLVENHLHESPHSLFSTGAQGRDNPVISQASRKRLDGHR